MNYLYSIYLLWAALPPFGLKNTATLILYGLHCPHPSFVVCYEHALALSCTVVVLLEPLTNGPRSRVSVSLFLIIIKTFWLPMQPGIKKEYFERNAEDILCVGFTEHFLHKLAACSV